MSTTPNYPTLQEVRDTAIIRVKAKLAGMEARERSLYLQQMGFVRDSGKFSGTANWTAEHTEGSLFTCGAIKAALLMLRAKNSSTAPVPRSDVRDGPARG